MEFREASFISDFELNCRSSQDLLFSEMASNYFTWKRHTDGQTTVIRRVKIPVVVQLAGPWFIHRDLSPIAEINSKTNHRIKREGEAIRNAAALRAASASVLSLTEKYYGPLKALSRVIPNPIAVKSELRTAGRSKRAIPTAFYLSADLISIRVPIFY